MGGWGSGSRDTLPCLAPVVQEALAQCLPLDTDAVGLHRAPTLEVVVQALRDDLVDGPLVVRGALLVAGLVEGGLQECLALRWRSLGGWRRRCLGDRRRGRLRHCGLRLGRRLAARRDHAGY